MIGGTTTASIRGNEVEGNSQQGMMIRGHAKPEISDNQVYGNDRTGIRVTQSAVPDISENSVYGNQHSGIWVEGNSSGQIRKNELYSNGGAGILVGGTAAKGQSVLENNHVYQNQGPGVKIEDAAAPAVLLNRLEQNTQNVQEKWHVNSRQWDHCGAALLSQDEFSPYDSGVTDDVAQLVYPADRSHAGSTGAAVGRAEYPQGRVKRRKTKLATSEAKLS